MPTLRAGRYDEDPRVVDDRDEAVIEREPCANCGERYLEIVETDGWRYTLRCLECDETCERDDRDAIA